MAFTLKTALNPIKEELFIPPQDNIHLFENFVNQFNNACKKLNNTTQDVIKLRYYLMNEVLSFEVLMDAQIPLVDFEKSNNDVFYFDEDLSFGSSKENCFHWSFQNSTLFKYLIENKRLKYYANKPTTLDDLIKKYSYEHMLID